MNKFPEKNIEKKESSLMILMSFMLIFAYFLGQALFTGLFLPDVGKNNLAAATFMGLLVNAAVWILCCGCLAKYLILPQPREAKITKKINLFLGGCCGCFFALLIFAGIYNYFDIKPEKQQVAEIISNLPDYYLPVIILGPALLVPLIEEILFRSFLYRSLTLKMGKLPAMLIASALFAVVHFEPHSMAQLFVLGFIFNIVYEKSGSLAACVGIHAVNNSFAIIALLFTPQIEEMQEEQTKTITEQTAPDTKKSSEYITQEGLESGSKH